jgi:hypothetical protein
VSIYVNDTLSVIPAPTSGTPTPTTTFQWLRGDATLNSATDSTYVADVADVGSTLRVRQIATNFLGTSTAISLPTTAVLAIPENAIVMRDGQILLDRDRNFIQRRVT